MTVKFLDLQAQYQTIKPDIERAVLSVLDSSAYVLGPEVQKFEEEFAAAHNVAHGVAVNTGTSALHVALLAAGVGAGDEVITTAMTFTATVAAISYTGATPVFVDVDPESFTIDPAGIEARITPKTKAIMPVHLYGQAADMDPILDIAKRHNLVVIEDAAQAHLAEYKGRRVGGIGAMAAFSFYPGKNLGAYGEGGLTTSSDDGYTKQMRLLRDWGQQKKYYHEMLAYNYRMDGIQGAILRVKLRHLEAWTEARRALAKVYQRELAGTAIRVAQELPERRHVYHIFSVFHPERDALQTFLGERGIQTGLHYPVPVHLQAAYGELGHKLGDFPITEQTANEQLSLPMYAELTEEEVVRVCDAVKEWLAQR
jgi:dTDP-4-amino-4,6-dideoxygalactose transaminase